MTDRTINDEINDIVDNKISNIPTPERAKITKIYNDGFVDILTETEEKIEYLRCVGGSPVVDGICVLLPLVDDGQIVIV